MLRKHAVLRRSRAGYRRRRRVLGVDEGFSLVGSLENTFFSRTREIEESGATRVRVRARASIACVSNGGGWRGEEQEEEEEEKGIDFSAPGFVK